MIADIEAIRVRAKEAYRGHYCKNAYRQAAEDVRALLADQDTLANKLERAKEDNDLISDYSQLQRGEIDRLRVRITEMETELDAAHQEYQKLRRLADCFEDTIRDARSRCFPCPSHSVIPAADRPQFAAREDGLVHAEDIKAPEAP